MHFLQRLKLRRGTPHLLILFRVILMGIRFLSHLVTAIHSVSRKWFTSNNFFIYRLISNVESALQQCALHITVM